MKTPAAFARSRQRARRCASCSSDLAANLPSLGERIYDGEQIRPFVNVYVDGEDVRTLGGLDAPVREHATVVLLPAMAGGCDRR